MSRTAYLVLTLCLLAGCATHSGGELPSDAVECNDYQVAAEQRLRDAQSCTGNDECWVTTIRAPCLPFSCPIAINRATNFQQLEDDVERLGEAHLTCVRQCPSDTCINAGSSAVCNWETRRCELRLLLTPGATGAAVGSDQQR
jgi:hypothetical protein